MLNFIFKGIGDALMHVPLMIWVVIFLGIIIFGIALRYLTNLKVDIAIAVVFVIVNSIFVWRQHWIDEGYSEALARVKADDAKVEAYKKTNANIMACYAQNTGASYLWDRTNGDCVRSDGAIGK